MVDEEAKKRAQAEHLYEVLGSDYLIRLSFPSKNPSSEYERILSILTKGLSGRASKSFEHWSSKKEVVVGFRLCEEGPNSTHNIIMGPYAELKEEAKEFRDFWGPKCKIRRFLDGTIKETIEIENRSGPAYLILAIIQHLKSVHFENVKLSASFFNLSPFVPMDFQSNEPLKRVRGAYSSLTKVLQDEASTENLPIRKIRCVSSVLHYGGDLDDRYSFKRLLGVGEGLVRDSKRASLLFNLQTTTSSHMDDDSHFSIPVRLDITTKKYLSPQLFAKLRLAYLIDLRRKLSGRDITSWVKGEELLLMFKGFNWRISVGEPVQRKEETSGSIFEFFYNLSLRHPCWSSTAWVIRKWISSRYLDGSIPDVTLDIILAHLFLNPVGGKAPPASVESAFLRFLDFLSFTDFIKVPLVLNYEKSLSSERLASFDKTFTLERDNLPPLASLTLFDDPMSNHTAKVRQKDLTRLVNHARKSLHSFLPGFVDLSSFEKVLDMTDDKSYDILIHLHHPCAAGGRKVEESLKKVGPTLPIMDFDPCDYYLESLEASYGDFARFYSSKTKGGFIGVKLNREAIGKASGSMMRPYGKRRKSGELVANVEAMVDDFRILGKGFVKSVELANCDLSD